MVDIVGTEVGSAQNPTGTQTNPQVNHGEPNREIEALRAPFDEAQPPPQGDCVSSKITRERLLGLGAIRNFVNTLRSRHGWSNGQTEESLSDGETHKNTPQNTAQFEKPREISRRRFLRNVTLVSTAVTTVDFWNMYHHLGRTLGEVASSREGLNVLINALSLTFKRAGQREVKAAYGVDLQENPHYRPMLSIIKEAVDIYTQQTRKLVTYRFHSYRNDDRYYDRVTQEGLDDITADDIVGVIRGDPKAIEKVGSIKEQMWRDVDIDEAMGNSATSENQARGFNLYFNSGLGDKVRAVKDTYHALPLRDVRKKYEVLDTTEPKTQQSRLEGYETISRQAVMPTMQEIFTEIIESGQPESVSASAILVKFLERNNGDLVKSIADVGIFLEILSRNDLETARYVQNIDPSRFPEFVARFRNVRDEYSILGHHFAIETADTLGLGADPAYKDLSPINLIGEPYHVWQIVGLLHYFPPGLIKKAVLASQLYELNPMQGQERPRNQGKLKTLADLQVLMELEKIERYLTGYVSAQNSS